MIPDKQYIEDTEVVADIPKFQEDKVEAQVDMTKYGLVAAIAKNGMVLLWEWKPIKEAREYAESIQKRI